MSALIVAASIIASEAPPAHREVQTHRKIEQGLGSQDRVWGMLTDRTESQKPRRWSVLRREW